MSVPQAEHAAPRGAVVAAAGPAASSALMSPISMATAGSAGSQRAWSEGTAVVAAAGEPLSPPATPVASPSPELPHDSAARLRPMTAPTAETARRRTSGRSRGLRLNRLSLSTPADGRPRLAASRSRGLRPKRLLPEAPGPSRFAFAVSTAVAFAAIALVPMTFVVAACMSPPLLRPRRWGRSVEGIGRLERRVGSRAGQLHRACRWRSDTRDSTAAGPRRQGRGRGKR